MNNTAIPKCPRCGADLPVNSTRGVCPRCAAALLQATQTEPLGESQSKPAFTPPAPSELASKFPQLEILGFIGQGGMGAVYKVRQRQLDRVVALKILPPGIDQEPTFAERFAREAKAMAKLNHPGIVTIHDFGHTDGLFYFLMELVDGVSLRQLMQSGRVSPREALAIVPQICDALQYAHDQGIVHRDIKPENILLDRQGRVKVADFGLAKLVGGSTEPARLDATAPAAAINLTSAGKVMGTPQYMAPEQMEHPDLVDHRADIYSLGVVFYQMLTGELPDHRLEAPSHRIALDVRLDEIVLRALEHEPERRYQQASQVRTAVDNLARPPASRTRVKIATTVAAALATVAVLIVVALAAAGHGRSPDIQGAWEGDLPFGGEGVKAGEPMHSRVVVKVVKARGRYAATIDAIDAGRKDLPVAQLTYAHPLVRLDYCPLLSFDGTVNADASEIIVRVGNESAVLKRTTQPSQVPQRLVEKDFTPRVNSDLQGYWSGTLGGGPDGLPLSWKIAELANGTFRAELDNLWQGANGQPVSVVYRPPEVELIVRTGSGMFKGKLNTTHDKLTGSWLQGGGATPTTFQRAQYVPPSAPIPEADFSFATETELQGHWKGTLQAGEKKLRFNLDLARSRQGAYSSTMMTSLDTIGNNDPVPVTTFEFLPPRLHAEWKWVGAGLDAELKGGQLTGTVSLASFGGVAFPAVLERSRKK